MTQDELSELYIKVRSGMGIFTDAQDDQIQPAFLSAVQYTLNAGVPESDVSSPFCVGVLARGTKDLWLEEDFSSIFQKMIGQMSTGRK